MYQQRIREIYPQLSPGYRRIADFLLKSYQDAAFMTAAQVGKAADVDTTLVVRFAQRLGYPGFPELIDDIQKDVKQDLRKVYETGPEDNTAVGILHRNLIQDRNNLEYALLHTDPAQIERIVEILAEAPRIFIVGDGNAMYLAEAFAMRLTAMGYCSHPVSTELLGQAAVAAQLRPGDTLVAFGVTRLTPSVLTIVKLARDEGAHTIAIVGSSTNPVASAAEHVLVVPVDTVGPLPSWTAIASVMHGLIQALAIRKGDPSAQWILRTDHLMQAYLEVFREGIASVRDLIADYNPPRE